VDAGLALRDGPNPAANLSGRKKAAVLLVSLGPESAAEVFKNLPDDVIEDLTVEMAKTRDVTPEVAEAVQGEIVSMAYARGWKAAGGANFTRDVLERALGTRRASEILMRLATVIEASPFGYLRGTPPDQIYAFLRGEHSQTVALVIANLPTRELSAKVIQLMKPDEQAEVALRIATMGKTSPDIVKEVAAVMREKLQSVIHHEYAASGGAEALADILNSADRGTERNILEHLSDKDAELADQVRALLFTFEDLLQLDDRSVQLVLKNVDTKDLALALRGSTEEVKHWILANMSERGGELLKEEIEYMPPQRRRVVEEAQSKIVGVVRKLEDSGEIIIARGGGDGAGEDDLIT
jgi:flagellar motor switch protein FliG